MPSEHLSFIQRLNEYGVWSYFMFFFIACWAGTVRFFIGVKNGNRPTFINWIVETTTSGFVGLICALACQYYEIDILLTGVIVGIAAHNGTRSLYLLTNVIKKN